MMVNVLVEHHPSIVDMSNRYWKWYSKSAFTKTSIPTPATRSWLVWGRIRLTAHVWCGSNIYAKSISDTETDEDGAKKAASSQPNSQIMVKSIASIITGSDVRTLGMSRSFPVYPLCNSFTPLLVRPSVWLYILLYVSIYAIYDVILHLNLKGRLCLRWSGCRMLQPQETMGIYQ